jgi:hypothetical protein
MSKKKARAAKKLWRLRVKAARVQAQISRAERRLRKATADADGGVGPNGFPAPYWRRKHR